MCFGLFSYRFGLNGGCSVVSTSYLVNLIVSVFSIPRPCSSSLQGLVVFAEFFAA